MTYLSDLWEFCLKPLAWPWPLPSARIPALRRSLKALSLALAFAFGSHPGLKAFP